MLGSGEVSAHSLELKTQVDSIISCLEEVEVRIPKEYKTAQLAKLEALHQELSELTQAVKDVIRYDLVKALDVSSEKVESPETART